MKSVRTYSVCFGAAFAVVALTPSVASAQKSRTYWRPATVFDAQGVFVTPGRPDSASVREILQREYDFANRVQPVPMHASFFASAPLAGAAAVPKGRFAFARLTWNFPVLENLYPLSAVPAQRAAELRDAVDPVTPLPEPDDSKLPDSQTSASPKAVYFISDEVARLITGQRVNTKTQSIYIQGGTVRIVDNPKTTNRPAGKASREHSPSSLPSGNLLVFSDLPTVEVTMEAPVDVRQGCLIVYSPSGLGRTALIWTGVDSSLQEFSMSVGDLQH